MDRLLRSLSGLFVGISDNQPGREASVDKVWRQRNIDVVTEGYRKHNIRHTSYPEQVLWAVNENGVAGITIGSADGQFVPWPSLKQEIEAKLLPQVYSLPVGSPIITKDFEGRRDWIVSVLNPEGTEIGHMWFGGDPEKEWAFDGLVRSWPSQVRKLIAT